MRLDLAQPYNHTQHYRLCNEGPLCALQQQRLSQVQSDRGCFAAWPGQALHDAPFAARRALSFAVAASMATTPLTFLNSWKHTRAPTTL